MCFDIKYIYIYMSINDNSNDCVLGTKCLFKQSLIFTTVAFFDFIVCSAKNGYQCPNLEPGNEFWNQIQELRFLVFLLDVTS